MKYFKNLNLKNIQQYLLLLFVFLLPWQTRYFFIAGELNGDYWETSSLFIYGYECFALIILGLAFLRKQISKRWVLILLGGSLFYLLFQYFFTDNRILFSAVQLIRLNIIGSLSYLIYSLGKKEKNAFMRIWVLSALLQVLFICFEFYGQLDLFGANKWLGIAHHHPEDLGVSVINLEGERWLRPYGTLPHPNILGGYLGLSYFLYLNFLKKLNGLLSKKEYYLNFAIEFVLLWGVLLTFSRSALVATAVGLIIFWGKQVFEKKKLPWQEFGKYFLIFILFFSIHFPLLRERVNINNYVENISISERQNQYDEANAIWRDNLLLGVGIDNYEYALAKEDQYSFPVWTYQPLHNTWLLIMIELGLFFGLLLCVFFYRWHHALQAMLIHSVFSFIFVVGLFDHYWWTTISSFYWLVLALVLILKKWHNVEKENT